MDRPQSTVDSRSRLLPSRDIDDKDGQSTTSSASNTTTTRPRSYGAIATKAASGPASGGSRLGSARTVGDNFGSTDGTLPNDIDGGNAVIDAAADAESALYPDSDSDFSDSTPVRSVHMAGHRRRLAFAFGGLFLLAFTTSLEGQVTSALAAFAVSSFQNHSLLSTVVVVQGVVNAVIKPPMAKMADVFGRLEAFLAAVLLCVIGYVQMAASHNVQTFAAAQIMYSAGITGLQVLQQILVADTTDLRHRALLSALPDTPFLVTVWIGPSIAAAILATTSWRWGYAMWAIILPIAFVPLGGSLVLNSYQARRQRRRSCLGLSRTKTGSSAQDSEFGSNSAGATIGRSRSVHSVASSMKKNRSPIRKLLVDLDAIGMLILSAALSMVLLPLTLASKVKGGWSNPMLAGSIVVGLLLLVFAFPAWESRPNLAPHPLIPPALLKIRTFCAGCGVAFFFFAVFYLSVQPYFYSYLLVAHNLSIASAGRVTQIFSFTSTIAAVLSSIVIRQFRRYKPFVVAGSCVYLTGVCLMLRYRTADAGIYRIVATQVFVGSGAGLMSVPAQLGIQTSVSSTPQLVAAATAAYLTMGEAGIAVGAAVSGALWGHLVPSKLDTYLPEPARQNASEIYSNVVVALSYPWGSPERDAIIQAYQESMTALLSVAVLFCIPVVILALLMHDYHLDGHTEVPVTPNPETSPGGYSTATTTTVYTVTDFVGTAAVGEHRMLLSEDGSDIDD